MGFVASAREQADHPHWSHDHYICTPWELCVVLEKISLDSRHWGVQLGSLPDTSSNTWF